MRGSRQIDCEAQLERYCKLSRVDCVILNKGESRRESEFHFEKSAGTIKTKEINKLPLCCQ